MPRFLDDSDFSDAERIVDSDPREAVSAYRREFFSPYVMPRAADLLPPVRLEVDTDVEAERRPIARQAYSIATRPRSVDLRYFNPTRGAAWPASLSGTAARTRPSLASSWLPVFSASALPCVDRRVRREVLFAKRRVRGSRKPKRRGWSSYIRC